ncbi:MAG TPA: TonB-dependent receptor [Pyrinomonadaceae bacterium]|nr:TonB-dependent receptor [Pyrinomonadaceae bacterium]
MKRVLKRLPARLLASFALTCAVAALAPAQVTTGALAGVVKDPNGAVVAGATVKVTNADTGISRDTTTNEEGFYRVTNLTPGGNYTVEVTAVGFAAQRAEHVAVRLATENSADVQLAVSGSNVSVDVAGNAEQLLQSSQNQLSTSYTPTQLTQLPFNGGAIDNLALLTPGITTPGDTDFANGTGISANGNRGRSNNFQIDGQDNNDNSVAGPALALTNTEAVGELQVITNNFSAEFGRNSGAQINAITKPGTNEFHGSLFEFHNNAALDAASKGQGLARQSFRFLNDQGFTQFGGLAGRRLDPFRNNRFGGAIGGPIKRNKAFFFVTYEGDRLRGEAQANNLAGSVLTLSPDSVRLAALAGYPGAQILLNSGVGGGPAFAQNQGQFILAPPVLDVNGDGIPDTLAFSAAGVAATHGATYNTANNLSPAAFINLNGVQTPLYAGEAVRVIRTDNDHDQIITREDINLSSRDTLNLRYIFDRNTFPLATGRVVAGALFAVPSKNNNLGGTYTRTLSSSMVNEARMSFSRLDVKFGDPAAAKPEPGFTLQGNADFSSNIGLTFGTPNNLPQSRVVDTYQFQDTLSSTLGNHAVKFGADIRHQKVDNFFLPNFLGTYVFTGSNPYSTTANANSGLVPATFPGVAGGAGPVFFFPPSDFGPDTARTGFRASVFENLLLARPNQVNFALGDPRILTKQNDFFFFAQDDWRVRPNLTLNLGLRYEVSTTPFNPIIEASNAREADPARAIFNQAFPLSTRTAERLPIDKNNLGPRVGFAWQPNFEFLGDHFSGGRTVVRGGFGVAYDPSFFNIVLNTVTAAPFAAAGTFTQTPGAAGSVSYPFLPNTTAQLNLTPGTNGGDPRLFNQTRVDPDFHNPYTMSYNFGVQQELWKNTVLEVRYVGSRIVGQFQTVNGNPDVRALNRAAYCLGLDAGVFSAGHVTGDAPATREAACVSTGISTAGGFNNSVGTNGNGRLDPTFGITRLRTNGATSTYNGMQLRFDTRLTNSLIANFNYTLSKTIDNSSEIFATGAGGQGASDPQNPFDGSRGERGLSAFHQKHVSTSNFVYELPWFKEQRGAVGHILGGFQLSGILLLGSGRPYTPIQVFGPTDQGYTSAFGGGTGALRPFLANAGAPLGTIAFGYNAACNVLFGGPYCDYNGGALTPGNFVVFNTSQPGSTGAVVTPAQVLSQTRLVYNDFGLYARGSVADPRTLEAFSLFKTPYGSLGRNTFSGDPNYTVNMAIFKSTKLTEGTRLELRAEAQNLLNSRNFGVPTTITEAAATSFTVGAFQNPGFNNGRFRTIRLGARFIF